jgi:hypothetical protein
MQLPSRVEAVAARLVAKIKLVGREVPEVLVW